MIYPVVSGFISISKLPIGKTASATQDISRLIIVAPTLCVPGFPLVCSEQRIMLYINPIKNPYLEGMDSQYPSHGSPTSLDVLRIRGFVALRPNLSVSLPLSRLMCQYLHGVLCNVCAKGRRRCRRPHFPRVV